VFGIPGVHNLELYRRAAALADPSRHRAPRTGAGLHGRRLRARQRRPGVCFTITGPGLTNIATAMGQAHQDSIPMLVISSQNRRDESEGATRFLHELPGQPGDRARGRRPGATISEPSELPQALAQAFRLFAVGRPRPAYIEIPRDLLASRVERTAAARRERARARPAGARGARSGAAGSSSGGAGGTQ